MSIKRELNYKLYVQREENIRHMNYETEAGFYHAIASGNEEEVNKRLEQYRATQGYTTSEEKSGVLSQNPVQNQKFHFVILAALITRFCVEEGLDHETAYNMSDIFIQKCDLCNSVSAIEALKEDMIYEYVATMKENKRKNIYSKHITKCIDYIHDNLNKKLTVDIIANHLKTAPTYLSKLFSKELNMPISAYIREQRLEAAANMLQYSNFEISEIAEYFQFSSQSHFTSLFQEKYKQTPKRYRDTHTNKAMSKQNQ